MKKAILFLLLLLCLALPVHGAYVFDEAEILDDAQWQALEDMGSAVSDAQSIGYYIVTIENYEDYGFYDAQDCADWVYEELDLRESGLLLLMSMENRQYALIAHGDSATQKYSASVRERIIDGFLDNFHGDDWYGGFRDFYQSVTARSGTGIRFPAVLLSLAFGGLTALLVCSILKRNMKSVAVAAEAGAYLTPQGVQFHIREDRYTHSTHTRVRIQRNEDHGGHSSHGSSGSF